MDDFYSLSMLRDVIFPVREPCFTVGRIEAALKALDLRFCGFHVGPDVRRAFLTRFGAESNLTSLAQWGDFEAESPYTFANMYHFIVEKS